MPELMSTKTFRNFPTAHRQWRNTKNCCLIHGYSRAYRFVFAAQNQDQCGFVVDFGDLDWLRDWLEMMFDHTLLLEADDPHLDKFKELEAVGACNLRIMPYGVGMEGSAQWVGEYADLNLRARTKGRAWVVSVEAFENDKNSAIWTNPDAGFKGWL